VVCANATPQIMSGHSENSSRSCFAYFFIGRGAAEPVVQPSSVHH
jgi:hypothetical protein